MLIFQPADNDLTLSYPLLTLPPSYTVELLFFATFPNYRDTRCLFVVSVPSQSVWESLKQKNLWRLKGCMEMLLHEVPWTSATDYCWKHNLPLI